MTIAPLSERAGSDTAERRARCAEVIAEVEARGLHTVRLAFADVHGLLRGKALRADLLADAFANGLGITSALLIKDTGQFNVFPVWADGAGLGEPWLTGAGDVMMLPDPATFRVLPWLDGTGWILCDIFGPNGEAVPFSTRAVARNALAGLAELGHGFRAGLEVEFHLYRRPDPATTPTDTHPGRVYLGEQRLDLIEPILDVIRQNFTAMGRPPRSLEVELGPSQAEITFDPADGLTVADDAVLLRAAIKQIAARHGHHATFMARPHRPDSFASGWHLHQSLVSLDDDTDSNSEARNHFSGQGAAAVSDVGRHYLAGLLAHAGESCLLTTPTITGYKRYRPGSLAPLRASWAPQHRGAMLRVIGGPGDPATRIENRVGDSAGNPYLYLTSQIVSGRAGLLASAEPPPAAIDAYDESAGEALPRNLGAAVDLFASSELYRTALGAGFVEYLSAIKRAEWQRFLATVTDWEQTEYFELF